MCCVAYAYVVIGDVELRLRTPLTFDHARALISCRAVVTILMSLRTQMLAVLNLTTSQKDFTVGCRGTNNLVYVRTPYFMLALNNSCST